MKCGRMIIAAAVLASVAACNSGQSELRLAIGGLEVNQEIVRGLAEQVGGEGQLHVSLVDEGDRTALDMLATGEADLALVENTVAFQQGIVSLLPIYTGVLHIVYRSDLDPDSDLSHLAEASIYSGTEGSLSYVLMQRFLSYSGVEASGTLITTEFDRSNPPDVIAVFGPIARDRIAGLENYRLHSMGTPDSIGKGSLVDGVRKNFPQLRPYVIPIRTYGDMTPDPVVTLAVDMVLVARAELDSAAVYDLFEQLVAARPALAAQFPSVYDGMRTDFDPDTLNFPLHPGARRYLDRDKPTVYERFADVVDAGVTVLLALLSGGLALMRYLNVRRKNRIDDFYGRLLDVRSSCRESQDVKLREASIVQVEALEDEAFRLLMSEKLSANESFRIFITLAHDVLRELRSRRSTNS